MINQLNFDYPFKFMRFIFRVYGQLTNDGKSNINDIQSLLESI